MNYKALYRTYRPHSFDEVVGQDHIVNTLRNAIARNRISHAYLFTGPRGTGKTSVAHIFAREVNRSATGLVIADQLDIIEIDAASNNGVAEIRQVIDAARYAPTSGLYKVYIIDEVHMLSKGAFNALLKTLEEPPRHVIFILATTEAHKLPETILSRTQRFNFKRIDEATLVNQLKSILVKEKIEFEDNALKLIARLAEGGMRDALSIAEQAAAFSNNFLTFVSLSQVFGLVSLETQIKLLNHANAGETAELIRLVREIIDNGADIERTSASLVRILKDFIIYKKTRDHGLTDMLTKTELERLNLKLGFAYQAIDILMALLNSLRFSEFPLQAFELAILKMSKVLSAEVMGANDEVKAPVSAVREVAPRQGVAPITPARSSVFTGHEEAPQPSRPVPKDTTKAQVINNLFETPQPSHVKHVEAPKSAPVHAKESEVDFISLLSLANKERLAIIKGYWSRLLGVTSSPRAIKLAHLLSESKLIAAGKHFCLIGVDSASTVTELQSTEVRANLFDLTTEIFGEPLHIYPMTREVFDRVKAEFAELRKAGKLPSPQELAPPQAPQRTKSKAESYGEDLFGEVLNFNK